MGNPTDSLNFQDDSVTGLLYLAIYSCNAQGSY